MSALGLGLAGIILGVAGSEFLRKLKPDFVKKIEDAAKRFADGRGLLGSDSEDSADEE